VSIFFVGSSVLSLEQRTIFELVSQYFGFSMDLGDFFSFFSIISFGWLLFQPYRAFVDSSYITNVSQFIIHVA
jgi:hypothetical protein